RRLRQHLILLLLGQLEVLLAEEAEPRTLRAVLAAGITAAHVALDPGRGSATRSSPVPRSPTWQGCGDAVCEELGEVVYQNIKGMRGAPGHNGLMHLPHADTQLGFWPDTLLFCLIDQLQNALDLGAFLRRGSAAHFEPQMKGHPRSPPVGLFDRDDRLVLAPLAGLRPCAQQPRCGEASQPGAGGLKATLHDEGSLMVLFSAAIRLNRSINLSANGEGGCGPRMRWMMSTCWRPPRCSHAGAPPTALSAPPRAAPSAGSGAPRGASPRRPPGRKRSTVLLRHCHAAALGDSMSLAGSAKDDFDPCRPLIVAEDWYGALGGVGPEQAHPLAQQLQRSQAGRRRARTEDPGKE